MIKNLDKTVTVYIGDDKYVAFTYETFKKFESAYINAVKNIKANNLDMNDYAITSEYGHTIILSYAKFVIQYLENNFKSEVM